jgi:bifunctional oligoribonuclease and PAP phosphatase NrnA
MKTNGIYTRELVNLLRRQLDAAERILIVTHIRPDGDAIGSLLGLGIALQQASKTVQMVCEDGVPASLLFLSKSRSVRRKPDGPFDLVIVLDCSDRERTGKTLGGLDEPDWNIDHHVTNLEFGRVNVIDPKAVATAEMVAELIPQLGLKLSKTSAEALLTGMITDTIGFQTSNMTSKALRLAAHLMENGAELAKIYRQSLVMRSFPAIRLWANGLAKAQKEDGLIWTALSKDDCRSAGYSGRDDADLVQILSSVEDVDIAVIFVEQPKGRVKISWRAQPGFDVSQIALKFGGGGHPAASGAELPGKLDDVQKTVIAATRLLMEKNGYE